MKTNTINEIYDYINLNAPIWVTQIANHFWFSTQIIHRHIKKLLEENRIIKSWNSPKVFYFPGWKKTELFYDIDG